MAGDFRDLINPLLGARGLEPHGPQTPHRVPPTAATPRGITGHIVSLQRGARHAHEANAQEGHLLDLSVGGGEYTDIVVRVPTGDYGMIEGRRVVLHIIED